MSPGAALAPLAPQTPAAQPTAAPAAATLVTGPAAGPRNVSSQLQGAAPAGLTVRVKGIELGEDATILTVSASFASQMAGSTKLAFGPTFLETTDGQRLMLKRPEDNRDLLIRNGDTMEGRLVFLGSVPPPASQLRLVINEGADGSDLIGPGLVMDLSVAAAR